MDQHMAGYREALDAQLKQYRQSCSGTPISSWQAEKVRRLYRRLAKLLHPDLNPEPGRNAELQDLFRKIMAAYRCNDLKRLEELEVLTDRALRELGIECVTVPIPDAARKIEELEREISRIVSEEPYTYKDLLADTDRVEGMKTSLKKELEDYRAYNDLLRKHLEGLRG